MGMNIIKEKNSTGHLAAFLTILIWGTTFVSTKILLVNFTPIEILFYRFAMGLLALLIIYLHRLKLRDKSQELVFAEAGLCGVTLYYLLENLALTYTQASNVGFIICIAPFFTAILAHRFLDGEPLAPQFFSGFLVAIVRDQSYKFKWHHLRAESPWGYTSGSGCGCLGSLCNTHPKNCRLWIQCHSKHPTNFFLWPYFYASLSISFLFSMGLGTVCQSCEFV